jgi:2-oxoglutarate ferredoxin oxidoreductase subunit delta
VERVIIDRECCKGCELCVDACPRSVLVMSHDFNTSGYHYSVAAAAQRCNSCTFCAVMCPDMCIQVNR